VNEPVPTPPATAAPPDQPRRSRRALVQRILLAVLLAAAIWALLRNRAALADALHQMSPVAVALAFLPAVASILVSMLSWRELMADLGHRLPVRAAARIFYLSQLGKYLPGSVWSILTQIELSRGHRIPKRSNITVGVLSIAVAVATGLSLAALLMPFSGAAAVHRYGWIVLLVPVLLGALHPAVLGPALNRVLRLLRRQPLPRTPSWAGMSRVVGLQSAVWLLLGLQAWVLLLGLGAPPLRSLPVAVGGYALSYALGQLAIGLPAGAGVRETALTLVLSTVVPPAQALVVALLSRAVLTLVELGCAGVVYAIDVWPRRDRPAGRDGATPAP
jgi:uncharacterized membrane protein YbhN (UPF0104 family)